MKKQELKQPKRKAARPVKIPLISEEQIAMIEQTMINRENKLMALMGEEMMRRAIDGMKKMIFETNQMIMVENAKHDLMEALKRVK